jgi:hypothetical protein
LKGHISKEIPPDIDEPLGICFEFFKPQMLMDSKKSINRPRASKFRPGERVEPFEFISNGGRGNALSRRVKSPRGTFYEVINIRSQATKPIDMALRRQA